MSVEIMFRKFHKMKILHKIFEEIRTVRCLRPSIEQKVMFVASSSKVVRLKSDQNILIESFKKRSNFQSFILFG
ncbi:CLUMA_CG018412, isoform A [Clunio marinus]|uniref:CLUMA_CG018412, isoform A n=1 Tax=Clunio marinus TaxID=568069 RepID=A0A1J1IYJ1_9DIPT|nr:CLUMA_CG018412, isoform A [Clunio marinus]